MNGKGVEGLPLAPFSHVLVIFLKNMCFSLLAISVSFFISTLTACGDFGSILYYLCEYYYILASQNSVATVISKAWFFHFVCGVGVGLAMLGPVHAPLYVFNKRLHKKPFIICVALVIGYVFCSTIWTASRYAHVNDLLLRKIINSFYSKNIQPVIAVTFFFPLFGHLCCCLQNLLLCVS